MRISVSYCSSTSLRISLDGIVCARKACRRTNADSPNLMMVGDWQAATRLSGIDVQRVRLVGNRILAHDAFRLRLRACRADGRKAKGRRMEKAGWENDGRQL